MYCVNGFRAILAETVDPDAQLQLMTNSIEMATSMLPLVMDIINNLQTGAFDLSTLDVNQFKPILDTAMLLYEPTYAGFLCIYWRANGFATNDCDDSEYKASQDTDLAAWIGNVNVMKTMVEDGNANVMDLLDCFALDIASIMGALMGGGS